MDEKKFKVRLKELQGDEDNKAFGKHFDVSEGTIRRAQKGDVSKKTIKWIAEYKHEDPEWVAGNTDIRSTTPEETKTAENTKSFESYKNDNEKENTDEYKKKIFYQNAAARFGSIFQWIAEEYGEDNAGLEVFMQEFGEYFHEYRSWLQDLTEERRSKIKKRVGENY